MDITQWAVFRDHGNTLYCYRTYEDMTLRALELKTVDLSPGGPRLADRDCRAEANGAASRRERAPADQ